MCGITGIISLKDKKISRPETRIKRMTDMLTFRGPDYQGVYVSDDKKVAMGNTRLAISDPHNPLPQPMKSRDNKYIINYNGEIYNDLDLRNSLQQKGIKFRSNLDTEILLEGLHLHGEDFLHEIDGMWAFAYFDKKKNEVLLSRDVLGERHIFYRIINNEFIFCSEIPPIIADAMGSVDMDFINIMKSFRYGVAPPGETIIKGIKRMLPGHNIMIRKNQEPLQYLHRILHPEKWFDFFNNEPSLSDTINTFQEIFYRVCKRRIPREVPYASTLSGGLDSAIVALYASDFGEQEIDTVFAHSDPTPSTKSPTDLSEFRASQISSCKIKSNHHTDEALWLVGNKYTALDLNRCIDALLNLAGNAFDGLVDEAAASLEILAWQGRNINKKVMLISEGPDELSGGYICDQQAFLEETIQVKNWLMNIQNLIVLSTTPHFTKL